MVLCDFVRVQRLHLRLIRHTIGKLADTGKNTGAVGLVLAILLAHSKFDCEPIDGSQSSKFNLASAEGGQSDLLREISKLLMRKHGRMSHQLVDDIRLWCVQRLSMMSDILC